MEIKLIKVRLLMGKRILMLIMKMFIFFMCTTVFCFSTEKSFSQDKVTIDKDQLVTIDKVFRIIRTQTDLNFIYPKEYFKNYPKIELRKGEFTVPEILNPALAKGNLNFSLQNNTIFISKTHQVTAKLFQQRITGIVTDANGLPLPGASVLEKGTGNGTMTDMDGKYQIDISNPDAVLVFSYVSFKTMEIPVANQTTINATLKEDLAELEEVVVVGYGVQKKETLSGAVSSVKGSEVLKTPATNVSQGVVGRLPGVVGVSNTGEPGYDGVTLRIRGVNTFGDSSPLIVVDGVPGRSLERINPNTIESISVLKDASAAIYGAQAANGVILITTKRGKSGKPKIDISYNQGYAKPSVVPEMANAAQYATLLNEIDYYNGNPARYTEEEIQKYADGSDPWLYPNTDWFGETLKPWSSQSFGNVSISGGSDTFKYFVSTSQKSQDGYYRNSGTKYNQYDLRSNMDWKVTKSVDMYLNINGRMEDRNFPVRSAENIFRMLMRSKPNTPAYWPNGLPGPDIEFGDNPVVISTKATGYNHDKRYVFNTDFGINVDIPWVKGLKLTGKASLDKGFRFRKVWQTPWYLYTWDRTSYDENGEPVLVRGQKGFSDARLNESMEDNQRIMLSGLLNYNRTFDDAHTVGFLAGAEKITYKGDAFDAYRRYYLSTAIDELFAGGQDEMNNGGSGFEQARLNYFGRVNYAYKNKYLAEFVWRYQASYIFSESERYGFFPGVSLGYVVSTEDFWKDNVPFINFFKLRASWGKTGNDLIPPYQFSATYLYNNLLFISDSGNSSNQALYEGTIPNPNATWESAVQKDIGVDLEFLDGKIAVTADYFHNERSDILVARNASVPNSSGLNGRLPDENIGRFENKGVDFNIVYRGGSQDFNYSIGFNGVFTKNKVLFWDETAGRPEYQQSTGRPLGSDLYYNAIGIFQTQEEIDAYPHWNGARPGDIIFEDYNEDGIIDANDMVRIDKSRTPTFTGGLTVDLSYKGFDLSLLLQGATGGVFYQTTESGDFGNYLKSFYNDRWTEDNPSTEHPRTYNRNGEYWVNQRNTYWLHKTDYLRLKNVELGYTINSSFSQKFGIDHFRLYVSAFNYLTYSPDMDDYDPENTSGSGYNYPLNKVLNFGTTITF